MNHSVKVMPRGQVTLPAEVLDRLGVKPGDRVDIVPIVGGTFELRPLPNSPSKPSAPEVGLSHLKGLFGAKQQSINFEDAISETVQRRTDPNRSEMDP